MKNRTLDLALSLIKFRSYHNRQKEFENMFNFVERWLEKNNLNFKKFTQKSTVSYLINNMGRSNLKPEIMLHGHLDVVPASKRLFEPKINGDKLYARGACDMKGAVSAMLVSMTEIQKSKEVQLLLTSDEERGGINGTKFLTEKMDLKPKIFISGEPTNFNICTQTKGVIRYKITTKGKTAHASKLWEGENALLKMIHIVNKILNQYPLPTTDKWQSTINFSKIKAGTALNMVPKKCSLYVDIRYISPKEAQEIIKYLAQVISKYKNSSLELVMKGDQLYTDSKNIYTQKLKKTAEETLKSKISFSREHFSSEARYLSAYDIPSVNFGPIGTNFHSDKEWVSIKSLEKYLQILVSFTQKVVVKN